MDDSFIIVKFADKINPEKARLRDLFWPAMPATQQPDEDNATNKVLLPSNFDDGILYQASQEPDPKFHVSKMYF